ncbi:Nitrogen assimilation regulatory protein [hydrothermal vent metagenome]|uniref:Nitrogen assimilation regulatory protein n=1 Tax=hydrothermal vent metagenome TaxID=652676 RepID=A0A3B0Y2S3_9ZZZZ
MMMTHPGLPAIWGMIVIGSMVIMTLWAVIAPLPGSAGATAYSLTRVPLLRSLVQHLVSSPKILPSLKIIFVALFLLVIYAGLFGNPIPERNIATVLTWNIWWAGLIFSVFFLGTAWCAVCPWDTLAQWLVRRRLWKRAEPNNSLNLRVPRALRTIWPALLMFIALTWLELGLGITTDPYATAIVSLLMVVLATSSLAIFERKAFCRYFCPVGRTVGFYSQLAPVELRPINTQTCADCKSLDCYYGDKHTEPCPTWLVMGRLKQNSYCTSCGNCVRSCTHNNIAWRLRAPSIEAVQDARPRHDEAWFMIGLLALTGFHGLSMMSFWEAWMSDLARMLNDSGQLLVSFTVGMFGSMAAVVLVYALFVLFTRQLVGGTSFRRLFMTLAFVALPLAFAYHMAHNLNHLVREGVGVGAVFENPLGTGMAPLSTLEKHARHLDMLISQETLFAIQAGLMVFGFWIAVQIVRHRGHALLTAAGHVGRWRLAPMLGFVMLMTGFHLWLLSQPMTMRM